MKKFIAVMMILVMMVGTVAHAELRFKTAGKEVIEIGKYHNGTPAVETIYYLIVESDAGDSVKLEVSESEYKRVEKLEKDAEKSALGKVKAFVTFWDKND